ncbi:MAG: hypothetical protein IT374_23710 [Polyangiaceae bacterium]|nr:hypothetical protein [Polyangiaceae bacterium]
MRPSPLVALSLLVAGCAQSPPSKDASREPAPSAIAFPAPPASTSAAQAAPAPAPPPQEPASTASAPVHVAAPDPATSAPPADASPPPKVRVANIGMHIGGGPDANQDANKAPIRESVAPHFDEFRRCWALLGDPKAKGTFGVDLLIPREGGKLKSIDRVRTSLKGAPFKDCMLKAFEGIDFKRPRTGLTKVSYSLELGG